MQNAFTDIQTDGSNARFGEECTDSELNDKSDENRIVRCSSLKPCFNNEKYEFDNSQCSKSTEVCAEFKNVKGVELNGCIHQ